MIDQCLGVRVHHDLVELRMMEVFQHVDSNNYVSCAFTLIIVEVLGSEFQPTPFNYAFTSKYIKAYFQHRIFHDGFHWKDDFVDLSRWTNHLVAWLHWSFMYDDLIMVALK
jgi:hypothetical protein